MGATTFTDIGHGKDATEAFNAARRLACHEYGHGGYTGTIAEKPGFVIVPRPPRVKASDVLDALAWASQSEALVDKTYPDWSKWWKPNPRAEKEWKRLERWYGATMARRLVNQFDSKWDDCIAVECSDAEAQDYKKRNRIGVTYELQGGKLVPVQKRVRCKVFLFGGWASC